MKVRMLVLVLFTVLTVFIGVFSSPAGSDCTPGIKKEYLNTEPNAFCDGVSIEIDPNKGLQVKSVYAKMYLSTTQSIAYNEWTVVDFDTESFESSEGINNTTTRL